MVYNKLKSYINLHSKYTVQMLKYPRIALRLLAKLFGTEKIFSLDHFIRSLKIYAKKFKHWLPFTCTFNCRFFCSGIVRKYPDFSRDVVNSRVVFSTLSPYHSWTNILQKEKLTFQKESIWVWTFLQLLYAAAFYTI